MVRTWMIKVKLSPGRCHPLTVTEYTVEALLTNDLHAAAVLSVRRVLAECTNDLLAYCRLTQQDIAASDGFF